MHHIVTKQVLAGQRQVLITPDLAVQGSRPVRVNASKRQTESTSHHQNGGGEWWRMVPASSAVAAAAAILVGCSPLLPSQAHAAAPLAAFGLTTEQNVKLLPPIPTTFDPLPELTLPSFSRVGFHSTQNLLHRFYYCRRLYIAQQESTFSFSFAMVMNLRIVVMSFY